MIVSHLSTEAIRIPMRVRFSQSNQDTQRSDSLIVRVHTQDGIVGYGECCPRTYVTGETEQTVTCQLRKLSEGLTGQAWDSLEALCDWLEQELPADLGLAATCGLELALLDAWGKHAQLPLSVAFGADIPQQITYSGVIPMSKPSSLEPLLSRFRFSSFKIKIGSDLQWNLARVGWLHRLLGEEIDIRADVNGAWSLDEALRQIPILALSGIHSFEQALAPEDDHHMPVLMKEYGRDVILMADESVTTLESARRHIDADAFNAFNLKLSKHGGLLRSLAVADLARQHGIPCQLGAHFGETSLLTSAGILFAALAPPLRHHEGGLGTWLLERDVCETSVRIDGNGQIAGKQYLESGPGWGLKMRFQEMVMR